jgi:plastocyanin
MSRFAFAALVIVAVAAPAHAEPTGSVKGVVTFDGKPPERTKVMRDTDPYCARTEQLSDDVIVTGGKLKDVLVRVKNGALPADKPAQPPAPAVLDQKNCTYSPHVVGVVVGQQLQVKNSDGTFHNVHGTIAGKLAWNKPAAPNDPPLALDTAAKPGDVMEIVCDVHPWMHSYAVVQDHTKFVVTGDDGAFELKGLAPGTYTIEAWHPMLGLKSTTVKVGKAAATAKLSFQPSDLKPKD